MFLMYVDESGDVGTINSPTNDYFLSAIVVHELDWLSLLNDLIAFRQYLKVKYKLALKEEIHASVFMNKNMKLFQPISLNNRLDLLKKCIDWLSSRNDISIITVRVIKRLGEDPFAMAWKILLQRFENTLLNRNFRSDGMHINRGMILSDNTDAKKLTNLIRKMRRYNHLPSVVNFGSKQRNIPLTLIIEDPNFRNSNASFMLQMVDVVAYFARQYFEPKKYIRQKGARNYYGRLRYVINPFVTKKETDFKIITV